MLVYLEKGFLERSYVYAMIGYGIYFTINEGITFYVSGWGYFREIWNYIDIARVVILFVYAFIKLDKINKREQELHNGEVDI